MFDLHLFQTANINLMSHLDPVCRDPVVIEGAATDDRLQGSNILALVLNIKP